jgi:hypothetical protein
MFDENGFIRNLLHGGSSANLRDVPDIPRQHPSPASKLT